MRPRCGAILAGAPRCANQVYIPANFVGKRHRMPTDGTTPSAWSRLERRARARWFRPSRGDLRRLRPVLRPLPVVAAATCLLHRLGQEPAGALAADPTEAVLAGLRARGLSARRDDVHFL